MKSVTSAVKSRWVRRGLLGLAVVVVVAAVLQLAGALPKLFDPFGVETIDRSQPAVLQAVRDLSQYHATAGDYQVVLDIEQDVPWVPSVIAGERSLFVAAGTVNAYVDFGSLVDEALTVAPDRASVTVRLPEPRLDKPNIDNRRSYLFSQDRGVINRIDDAIGTPDQQRFYVAAEERIAAAARESGLLERARANTKAMLTGLLQALGYRVTFVEDPRPE